MRLEVESPKGAQTIVVSGRSRRLTDALRHEQLPLNTRCGQRSLCDGCVVELLAGQVVHMVTGEVATGPRSVRGCEYRLPDNGTVRLRIPPRSLLMHKPQIVSEFHLKVPRAHDPLWQRVPFPVSQRRRPVRLAPGLTPGASGAATLEYRNDHWLVTGPDRAVPAHPLGVAVDIGTTTVALLLVDLSDGQIVGRAAEFNKQMHLGDDVATRIGLCAGDKTMIGQLQAAVVEQTLVPLLTEALRQANAPSSSVTCFSICANTTMLHLLAGVDPSGMGVYPFTPAFLEHRIISLPAFGPATVHLVPSAGAYIGADLTAGIVASGLAYDDGPSLLVDVGTNGEIILKAGDQLLGCATAAGPAFEGAGLTNGIRATSGAIEQIRMERNPFAVRADVIGGTTAIGVCGSAYVDYLAEGRRTGLLNERGRFEENGAADWIVPHEDGRALCIARGPGNQNIVISETDTAHLLQSKAAIGAGILTLLDRAKLTPAQVRKVYLAGGFGMHIRVANAIACGLLPGFQLAQVEVVGNTSLAGAYLTLLDCGALDEVARISRRLDVVELNLDPEFEGRYIDHLSLP